MANQEDAILDFNRIENKCGIQIENYRFKNENIIRIGNSVTIHYAGYFLQDNNNWENLESHYNKNKYKLNEKDKNSTATNGETDFDKKGSDDPLNGSGPTTTWHSQSVIDLLDNEFSLTLFCSTWPEHGDKILPGPVTFTLGGDDHTLVPSLVVAIRKMKVGEVMVVKVPEEEVYGLDLSPVERRECPQPHIANESKIVIDKKKEHDEYPDDIGEPEGEEQETDNKKKGNTYYSSSSEESDYDPDEVICEPWCAAPGTKGEHSTFFHKVELQKKDKLTTLEVHRGLRGFVYVVQLLSVHDSRPPNEFIHIKKPLETSDKKSDKTEVSKKDA